MFAPVEQSPADRKRPSENIINTKTKTNDRRSSSGYLRKIRKMKITLQMEFDFCTLGFSNTVAPSKLEKTD